MKSKIKITIFILFSLLFLTGCNIDYEADFLDDGRINETINLDFTNDVVYEYNSVKKPSIIKELIKDKVIEYNENENYPLYKYKVNVKKNRTNVTFNYTYQNIEEFKEKNPSKYYFEKRNIQQDNNNYILSFSKIDNIMMGLENLKRLNVSVKSNNFIKKSNTTSENIFKGEYKWEIFGNVDDTIIKLTLTDQENWKKKYFENKEWLYYSLIVGFIILVFLIVLFLLYNKNKTANKI